MSYFDDNERSITGIPRRVERYGYHKKERVRDMSLDLVKFESTTGQEVTFTSQEVKDRLCPNITDKELAFVMALCQAQRLNPFMNDVYIQKFENKRDGGYYPASIITSKEVFTKRANANPNYEGIEHGVVYISGKQILRREGAAVYKIAGEVLIGGWARVYVKGKKPVYCELALDEYTTGKSNWLKMPAVMIDKCAQVAALRLAFPDDFQNLYCAEEMGDSGEIVVEKENHASDSEKTASNDAINVVSTAEFEEIASDEHITDYRNMCEEFAELCGKSSGEVHDAIMSSKAMVTNGAESDCENWTKHQMEDATHQLRIWIDKAKEIQEETELLDEDIPF